MPRLAFCLLSILFLSFRSIYAQEHHLQVDSRVHEYGKLENIYQLQSKFTLKNQGNTTISLLRSKSKEGLQVWASKKIIEPGDTALVLVQFIPKKKGKFKYAIDLITSESEIPITLKINGTIKSISSEDKTACYYFQNTKNRRKKTENTFTVRKVRQTDYTSFEMRVDEKSNSSIPDTIAIFHSSNIDTSILKTNNSNDLPEMEYMPNNIIFLIDVSGSMADSTKLKWLKLSVTKLIEHLRPTDKISIITYSDTVKCLANALSSFEKHTLLSTLNNLKAKGNTKGNKAIHFALDFTIQNYIEQGNNQIILASDGVFRFSEYDYKIWNERIKNRKIQLSTLAFGNDLKALINLEEISRKGNGNFIRIKSRNEALSAVIEEIKTQSRIKK